MEFDPIVTVRLPLLWGATLRLLPDGTVTLLTSEDECTLSDSDLDQVAELVARAQEIRRRP
jgi:hypothetical protein